MRSAITFASLLVIFKEAIAWNPYQLLKLRLSDTKINLPEYSPRARKLATLSIRVEVEVKSKTVKGFAAIADCPHKRCMVLYQITEDCTQKSNDEIERIGITNIQINGVLEKMIVRSSGSAVPERLLDVISKMSHGGLTLWKHGPGALYIVFYFYNIPLETFMDAYKKLSGRVPSVPGLPGYDKQAYVMAAEYTANYALLCALREKPETIISAIEFTPRNGYYIYAVFEAPWYLATENGITELAALISSEKSETQYSDRTKPGEVRPSEILLHATKGGLHVLKLREKAKYIIACRLEVQENNKAFWELFNE